MKIYAVYDKKADSFNVPFFVLTDELAKRAFVDLCRDERTSVAMHPEDFALWFIGEFDQASASIYQTDAGKFVASSIMTGLEARVQAFRIAEMDADLKKNVRQHLNKASS